MDLSSLILQNVAVLIGAVMPLLLLSTILLLRASKGNRTFYGADVITVLIAFDVAVLYEPRAVQYLQDRYAIYEISDITLFMLFINFISLLICVSFEGKSYEVVVQSSKQRIFIQGYFGAVLNFTLSLVLLILHALFIVGEF